jgi:hypothetical protein
MHTYCCPVWRDSIAVVVRLAYAVESQRLQFVQSKDEQAATPSCVFGSHRRSRRDCLLCINDAQTRNTATDHSHNAPHGLACSIYSLDPSIERMDCHAARPARSSPPLRDQRISRNQVVCLTLESSNRPTPTRYRILLKPSVIAKGSAVVMCSTTCSLTTWPCACTSPYSCSWPRQRNSMCPCR